MQVLFLSSLFDYPFAVYLAKQGWKIITINDGKNFKHKNIIQIKFPFLSKNYKKSIASEIRLLKQLKTSLEKEYNLFPDIIISQNGWHNGIQTKDIWQNSIHICDLSRNNHLASVKKSTVQKNNYNNIHYADFAITNYPIDKLLIPKIYQQKIAFFPYSIDCSYYYLKDNFTKTKSIIIDIENLPQKENSKLIDKLIAKIKNVNSTIIIKIITDDINIRQKDNQLNIFTYSLNKLDPFRMTSENSSKPLNNRTWLNFLHNSDFFLSISTGESATFRLLSAMSTGLNNLANINNYQNYINNNKNGFLFNDISRISSNILANINDNNNLNPKEIRKHIQEQFDNKQVFSLKQHLFEVWYKTKFQ